MSHIGEGFSLAKVVESAASCSFGIRTYHITNPFPLTEHLMCYYASFLADQGLATHTVKGYLSALRNMQISLGLPDPREQSSMPLLKRVQAGIARTRNAKGNPSRVRLPITPHLLRRIRHILSGSDHPERIVLGHSMYSLQWVFPAGRAPPTISQAQ